MGRRLKALCFNFFFMLGHILVLTVHNLIGFYFLYWGIYAKEEIRSPNYIQEINVVLIISDFWHLEEPSLGSHRNFFLSFSLSRVYSPGERQLQVFLQVSFSAWIQVLVFYILLKAPKFGYWMWHRKTKTDWSQQTHHWFAKIWLSSFMHLTPGKPT